MYKNIMVPVDLEHADRLGKALRTAADLAGHYGATVCYVGVAAATPGSVAQTPEEFERKLGEFARMQAGQHGHDATSKALISHDPAADLDRRLIDAVGETGADLVVMASHIRAYPTRSGLRMAAGSHRIPRRPFSWCADSGRTDSGRDRRDRTQKGEHR